MNQDEADRLREFLQAHAQPLIEAQNRGFKIFQDDLRFLPADKLRYRKGTACSIVRDHIVAEIKQLFPAGGKYSWLERGELFQLNIDGQINLQFKKMDSRKQVSQRVTKQVERYRNGDQTKLFLPGFRGYIGYIPNPTFTAVESYYITVPQQYHGQIEIDLADLIPNAILIPMDIKEKPQENLFTDVLKKRKTAGEKLDAGTEAQA